MNDLWMPENTPNNYSKNPCSSFQKLKAQQMDTANIHNQTLIENQPSQGQDIPQVVGDFLSHGVLPCIMQVMDDHELILKPPWWRLGTHHDLRTPQVKVYMVNLW